MTDMASRDNINSRWSIKSQQYIENYHYLLNLIYDNKNSSAVSKYVCT